MTDSEIIKALECCGENKTLCGECLYRKSPVECCSSDLLKDVIALINRQKSEIDILIRKKESLRDEIAEQQAEIERLKKDLAFREKQLDNTADVVEVVRCEDCIHYKDKGVLNEFDKPLGVCKKDVYFWDDEPIEVLFDDFCSYGKRR